MSWDIYGNPLRRGYCEVHPNVHEEYPCSICMAERNHPQINRHAHEEFERLQYEFAHQGDYIRHLESERAALAAQVKELKSELRQEKLIHIGFTNESQIQYVTEDKEEGAFYPNSDHGCYIPVYMLNVHAHRVGSESKIYCTQLEQGKKIAEIRAEAVKEFARKLGDAFILPHSLRKETQKAEFYKAGWRDAFLFANQYAEQIRWEVE